MNADREARISSIEVHHLRTQDVDPAQFDGSYETTLVRVHADSGAEGVGEAESLPSAIRAIIDGPSAHSAARAIREIVVGRDALDTTGSYRAMYAGTEFIGRRGLVMHAIGAVDIALWDLRARLEGVPLWMLLGEKRHHRIPVYTSSYPTPPLPTDLSEQLHGFRARGFQHFKLFVEPWWLEDFDLARELVATACAIAGPDGKVIVDGALAYDTLADAARLASMLSEEGVWMFEAPLHLDDITGHRALIGSGINIGVGDLGLTHRDEWENMIVNGHADVLQPDPSCVGGITGMREVADLAERYGCRLVPHGYKSRITLAASLHVLATREQEPLLEYCLSDSPLIRDLTIEQFPIGEDGCVEVPDAPGLGVTVVQAAVDRHRFEVAP